jgi:hypothetical protein
MMRRRLDFFITMKDFAWRGAAKSLTPGHGGSSDIETPVAIRAVFLSQKAEG